MATEKHEILLAGDVGGTKTNLALYALEKRHLRELAFARYVSAEFPSLDSMVRDFLKHHPYKPAHAGFGVPGPVKNGKSVATNLPWVANADRVARTLGIDRVGLINDLVANALGIEGLRSRDLLTLNQGRANPKGTRALVSAGTGLGQSHLFWDGAAHHPSPSEGGHSDFAPRSRLQAHLFLHLHAKHGHVSWERLLSGRGLHNIYVFLKEHKGVREPAWLTAELKRGDKAAVISKAALEGRSALCGRALDLFLDIYGAQAGNVALSTWATGGVYIGGGIAPKIIARMKNGIFMSAFLDKGRLSPLLAEFPVRVILNDKTALLGAALHGLQGAAAA